MNEIAYRKYIFYLMISLMLTTIGAFVGNQITLFESSTPYFIISIVSMMILFFSSGFLKQLALVVFCACEGFALSSLMNYYSSDIIFASLLITTIVVFVFAIIGLKAKNLSFLGRILFPLLICVLVYYIVNIFIPLPSISLLVILIFTGYVSYDMNRFKRAVESSNGCLTNDEIIDFVVDMYLNIINLFIEMLSIINDLKD